MKIFKICKTALHGCVATAIVALALLLASPSPLRADDDNKNKKKDSAPAKPATSPKTSGGSNSGPGAGKGGGRAAGDTGSANTTGRSGGTNNTSASGGDRQARHSGRTNSNANSSQSSAPDSTGGTHKEKKAAVGESSAPANSGGTHKERKAAAETTSTTTGTGSVSDTGGTNTTGKPGKHTGRNAEGTNTVSTGVTRSADGSGGTDSIRKGGKSSETAGSVNRITSASPGITRGTNGKIEVYRGNNGSGAVFRRDGTVREVHARNMTIIHLPGGSRRIVVDRADHSRIVAYRGGYGYVQRPFLYRGHEFASRTYLYRGRPYAAYYQRYPYRGIFLEGYRPYRYYRPAFYGWAYSPWRSPVRYSWGWAGNPWYGYYGGYFTPYPVYPSASFWLTDYFIASSLQAAYQQRADNRAYAFANPGDPVVLTPEIKEAIASEVQSQLALENSESQTAARGGDLDINSSGLPRILAEASPNHPHVFVVAGPLEVTDAGGRECGLTAGDVLRLATPPPPDATSVYLQVFASKNQECPRGTSVSVGLTDLQEMQNNMRSSIDQGLQELQAHEGGLPAPPSAAAGAPLQASFAPIAPPPDANVSSELQQQAQEADTAERGVLDEIKHEDNTAGGRDSNTPVQISLGQTTADVVAALGNPKRIVNLGAKRIYVYSDLKITFTNGKVTNVE